MKKNILYGFNWVGEGFNQVWAANLKQARARAKEMESFGLKVNPESFKAYKTMTAQNKYWKSFPLMDMLGAAVYLQNEMGLDKYEAKEVLMDWMKNYDSISTELGIEV